VDQLINNAGVGDYAPLLKASPDRQERMIELNITSLTLLTNLLLPDMARRHQGRILNVGSVAGFVPSPNMSVYAASKSFVLSFSEALYTELRGTGVTVTCLCPGATKTGFSRSAQIPSTHPIARSQVGAKSVAAYGYRSMQAGLPIAIPGIVNKLFITATRFMPRAAIRRFMTTYNTR
jgi:short-subunit dehydrogenase